MTQRSDNIVEFPKEVQSGLSAIAHNIKNASANLEHSAQILQLRSDSDVDFRKQSLQTKNTLKAAKKLGNEAKTLTRKINLLSSNLLK
ncbi:MAG: hypothetical protein NXI13_16915 [Proteobacteria bacterium]|nr:hypothetical protein [Pseudomonadota bacterium]